MSRIQILGIPIDSFTQQQAIDQLRMFVRSDKQHHVATPNNEMLVEAWKNDMFRKVLTTTALNIADSTGLLWAARHTGQQLPERVTGTDTFEALCKELPPDQSVFLLGAAEGVAKQAAQVLQDRYPQLTIAGTVSGTPKDSDAPHIVEAINSSGASVLFVAFGAPAQEMWIATHLHALPQVRLAMGIGGAFDFVAGVHKRAPKFMRKIGLEWLWRLLLQPSRIGRIARATLVFPILVLRYGRAAPR